MRAGEFKNQLCFQARWLEHVQLSRVMEVDRPADQQNVEGSLGTVRNLLQPHVTKIQSDQRGLATNNNQ